MAKLTAAQRKTLSTKVFGLPESRKYPLNDASHARNALSRASANATPEQQTRIRAKVHQMYPGMGSTGDASRMMPLSSMGRC